MRGAGLVVGPEGMKLYSQLVINRDHVSDVLSTMACWDLDSLEHELPKLSVPVWLVNDVLLSWQITHVEYKI